MPIPFAAKKYFSTNSPLANGVLHSKAQIPTSFDLRNST